MVILLTTVYVSNFETMCQLTPIRVLVEDKLVMYLQSYLKSAELLYQHQMQKHNTAWHLYCSL